ncbi:MAG TPA: endonuclease/exonuclease/phosphatase family protein [Blastocatellia bacterium]|nr:endonuclease/exonuclease/phosphatase family protein [Blastocatellia bacterium]
MKKFGLPAMLLLLSGSINLFVIPPTGARASSASIAPFLDLDIGQVNQTGGASFASGVFTVQGCGADIWGNADAFHFVYEPMNGDGEIVARVASVSDADVWSKGAVMIRESTSAGAAQAMMCVSPGKGSAFQRRTAASGVSTSTAGPDVAAPYWVKLTRSGSTFTAYVSSDGSHWATVGSDTINMASDAIAGLAVTSHQTSSMCTATFDNVSLDGIDAPDSALLVDNFTASSVNQSQWVVGDLFSGFTDTALPVTQSGGQIHVGPLLKGVSGSNYNGIRSANQYNFTDGYCFVEVVQPAASNTTADATLVVGSENGNFYRFFIEGSELICGMKTGSSKINLATATYDATNDKFLRIRHDSNASAVIFETAPDAGLGWPGLWTQVHQEAWDSSITLNQIQFEIKAGTWQTESNAPGSVIFDNFTAAAPAAVAPPVGPPPTPGAVSFKVMQCNIQWGNGTDNVYNLNRQVSYMVAQNPDILSLNEVPNYANQAQTFQQLLTQATGVTWNVFYVLISPGNNVGQAILTKWPIVGASSDYLDFGRSVGEATINVNGKLISFFSTHLDDADSSNRQAEVAELTPWMTGFAEPRIISGDFNSWPGGDEITMMTQLYNDSWPQAIDIGTAVAYPPDNPVDPTNTRTRRARIDYVFYSKGASNLTLTAARVPDTRNLSEPPVELLGTPDDKGVRPSDHNWYTATFSVK